jgi:DedD protein
LLGPETYIMSDTREASWYEIALTHSQIVKIFVVLLLCLVGAFFSGFWVGRDASATIQVAPPPVAATPEVADGREIAQLKFFSDDDVAPSGVGNSEPQPAIPELRAGRTLVDDLTSAEPEPQEETRIAEARGESVNKPDAPVAVTRQQPVVAAPAADQKGDLVVQVFSSNDATQARRVLGRLAQGGHPAYLSPVEVGGRTMYRVRIGPYAERATAESVAESVRRTFKLDTWITQKST